MAEGGCGGNSAVFLQKIEAKPAALLVQSRAQQKSFLFLLPARRSPRPFPTGTVGRVGAGGEEKIRRAQYQKCRENFFVG